MIFVLSVIEWIENHPVLGAALLGAVGVISIGVWNLIKKLVEKKRTSIYLGPIFYTFGKKYVVVAVHEYVANAGSSGYKQNQASRPDEWKKTIEIKSDLFGLRHKVVPMNPLSRLAVVIRTTPESRERTIRFNT